MASIVLISVGCAVVAFGARLSRDLDAVAAFFHPPSVSVLDSLHEGAQESKDEQYSSYRSEDDQRQSRHSYCIRRVSSSIGYQARGLSDVVIFK